MFEDSSLVLPNRPAKRVEEHDYSRLNSIVSGWGSFGQPDVAEVAKSTVIDIAVALLIGSCVTIFSGLRERRWFETAKSRDWIREEVTNCAYPYEWWWGG